MENFDPRSLTLVASDVAPIGGMERVAYELSRRLLERGWSVTVIARSCALAPQRRLRFVRLRSPSRPVSAALACDLVLGSLALARHRRGIVQTNNATLASRVDVIHAHFCERAFRRLRISRSRRGTLAYRLNSWLASWISLLCERWGYRPSRVRRIVCVSDGLARETAGCYAGAAELVSSIPNGVELASFAPRPRERARLRSELGVADAELLALFVGGDWHRKGLRYAIEALAGAPGWRLAVLGAGDRAAFAELAADAEVADRVAFLGHRGDPVPYYLAADALVAPSHFEAFPLVALEAAAAGLPLIVTRINGTEELVADGVNGWFIEREGPAIARRLRELSDAPAAREQMGRAARESAQRYDWERVVDRFEALYATLTA